MPKAMKRHTTQTNIKKARQQIDRQAGRQTDRETGRQSNWKANSLMKRHADKP